MPRWTRRWAASCAAALPPRAVEKLIAEGADPRSLSTWVPPAELTMTQPTRGMAILWGRKVRAEAFETEKGRATIARGYYDNGMTKGGAAIPGSKPGEYLMYTERQRAAIASEAHGGEKRAAKAKKKADKEKAGWGIAFSEFIARAGVGLNGAEEMDAAAMQL